MIFDPRKLTQQGLFGWSWNRLSDRVRSNKPSITKDAFVQQTTHGMIVTPRQSQVIPSNPGFVHPFKIRKSTKGLLKSGESGVDPFNGGALPTVDDAWRCFSIRAGIVGVKPQFAVIVSGLDNYNELGLFVDNGADGSVGLLNHDFFSTSQALDDNGTSSYKLETINIPNVGAVGATLPTGSGGDTLNHAVRWVLNSDLDANSAINAGFWIEITDSSVGNFPKAKIKARMWSTSAGATGRSNFPFDTNGPNIIPIGTVESKYGPGSGGLGVGQYKSLVGYNFISNHPVNRWPAAQLGDAAALVGTVPAMSTSWRGLFFPPSTDDYALIGKVFYPGDMVTISNPAPSSISGDFSNYNNLWIYISTPAVMTSFALNNPATSGFVLASGLL